VRWVGEEDSVANTVADADANVVVVVVDDDDDELLTPYSALDVTAPFDTRADLADTLAVGASFGSIAGNAACEGRYGSRGYDTSILCVASSAGVTTILALPDRDD
jgi:hypothetical protein